MPEMRVLNHMAWNVIANGESWALPRDPHEAIAEPDAEPDPACR
jgi:hypothetical protein